MTSSKSKSIKISSICRLYILQKLLFNILPATAASYGIVDNQGIYIVYKDTSKQMKTAMELELNSKHS